MITYRGTSRRLRRIAGVVTAAALLAVGCGADSSVSTGDPLAESPAPSPTESPTPTDGTPETTAAGDRLATAVPGDLLWQQVSDDPFHDYQAVAVGGFVAVSQDSSEEVEIHERTSGNLLETVAIAGEQLTMQPVTIGQQPMLAVSSEVVTPARGLEPAVSVTRLQVFDLPSTEPVYTSDVPEGAYSYLAGEAQIVHDADRDSDSLTATDLATGDTAWSRQLTPEHFGLNTFYAYDYGTSLYGIYDAATGEALVPLADQVSAQPVRNGGATDLWFALGADGDEEWVIDGSEVGARLVLPSKGTSPESHVEAEANVIAAADSEQLTGFDAVSGKQLWSRPFSGGLDAGITASRGGRLLIEANDQYAAVDARSGEQLWASGPSLPADSITPFYSDFPHDGAETLVVEVEGDILVFFIGQEYPVGMSGQSLVLAP